MGVTQACCVADRQTSLHEVEKISVDKKRSRGSHILAHREVRLDEEDSNVNINAASKSNAPTPLNPVSAAIATIPEPAQERLQNTLGEDLLSLIDPSNKPAAQLYQTQSEAFVGRLSTDLQLREGRGLLCLKNKGAFFCAWRGDWPTAPCTYVAADGTMIRGEKLTTHISEGSGIVSPALLLGLLEEGEFFSGDCSVNKSWEEYKGQLGRGMLYQGWGRLYSTESDGTRVLREGTFAQGVLRGQGTVRFSHGTEYKGELMQGIPHGTGTKRWLDRRAYTGQWFLGDMQGEGEFVWPDGRRYVGNYLKNQKHGYGEYYFGDGSSYRGYWYQGLQHGQGEIVDVYGKKKNSGEWERGEYIGGRGIKKVSAGPLSAVMREDLENRATSNEVVDLSEIKIKSNWVVQTPGPAKSSGLGEALKSSVAQSNASICEDYLDMSLEVVPSAVRHEIMVTESST